MRAAEHPQVSCVVDLQRWIFVRIVGLFDHDGSWPRNLTGCMVKIRDHLCQLFRLAGRTAVAEEGLVGRGATDRNRLLLLRIRRESAAVLVFVFVPRRLIHVPDTVVAIGLFGGSGVYHTADDRR